MEVTMIKVVGYARVSSDEQAAKDLSIPAQIKAIRHFVDESDEMTLVDIFKDEGISAYASADKRPGFMAMISLAKDSDVSLILVHKLDRFSRNREESIIFKSLLKKHSVQVKSITENFDPDTPSGFLFEGIIEVINQFYSMNLAMETRKGMVENVQRGYWNGGVTPYGYGKAELEGKGDRTHKKLVLGDPVEVATVRRIFDLAVNHGLGAKTISKRLNEDEVPYRNGKKWCKQRVGYILNHHVYYGAAVWNRTHTKTRTLKPEEEWIIQEGNHEPIISKEIFMKRKQMGQESIGDRFQSNAHKAQWLLAKMIRCGECGKAYVGVRRNKVMWEGGKKKKHLLNRYACSGHINQGNSKCRSFYIDQQFLENAVVSLVKNEIVRPMRLREIEDAVHKRLKQMQSSRDDTEKAYYARLQEINTGIDRFYDAIATGLDPDVCKQKIDELQQQKAFLEGELRDK
ncbi:MAG: recombinase family protein, partial [Chloroflexi bacterium]|nr:recombinase family protein [Chloroflexota bacterium]